jgi:cell division protein FtsI (penicillin-binding protein 3)
MEHNKVRWIRVRFCILILGLAVGFAAVAKGAWNLGVTRRDELRKIADDQYKRRITLPARRGMITARHGEPLAVEVEVESVYADTTKIKDPTASAAALTALLGEPEADLQKKLFAKRNFVWLKRRVEPELAKKVRALKIDGVELIKESKRFYPGRNEAAHVIGFSGMDSEGLEGIELEFEEFLKGRNSAVTGLRDARGHVVFADSVFGPDGVVGNTIELTIDRTLQHIAEQELEATIRTFNAKAGHVVVMDPNTGEVLALANRPTFNPNTMSSSSADERRNRAALDVFEPGSTLKVFTLAAALNSGVVRPDESIYCERGIMTLGDKSKVVIHDDHQDGYLTPNQCLKRSSNICFAKIAMRLGKKRLYSYLRRFGFGEPTHVELPFESGGTLRHYKKMREVDAAMSAFGQGVGVTNIQITSALAAIANGGTLMRPMLVRRIINPDGETIRSFSPSAGRRVISRYSARLVSDMMTSVTEEGGTGIEGALDGFLVAGKTGTAQKASGGRGYAEDKWISSFIGFVPADKPRLVISVIIDEPLINHYGGMVAAPALRRIADQSLKYLGVSPRQTKTSAVQQQASYEKGAGRLLPSEGEDEMTIAKDEEILSDPNQVTVPDLFGMSMKETTERLAVLGLKPMFQGTGFAREQIPAKGSPILPGRFVQVNFSPDLAYLAEETESEDESMENGDVEEKTFDDKASRNTSKVDEKKLVKTPKLPTGSTKAASMEAAQNEIRD